MNFSPLLPDCCCVLIGWICLDYLFVLAKCHLFDAYAKLLANHLIDHTKDYIMALIILKVQVMLQNWSLKPISDQFN